MYGGIVHKIDVGQVEIPLLRFFGTILRDSIGNDSIEPFYLTISLGMIRRSPSFIDHENLANIFHYFAVEVSSLIRM